MGAKTKVKKKKKFNIAKALVFILIIYIVICGAVFVYEEPVRHYEITGTKVLSDIEIIRELELEEYPSFISINTSRLEKILNDNVLIKEADVSYGWNFKLNIDIVENPPMFIVKDLHQICLSDGTLIDDTEEFFGLPTLLNFTPDSIMEILATNLNEVDEGVRYLISEIEYKPSYNDEGKMIDDKRFLLSMNDKNMVYITAKNTKSLNKYLDIIAAEQVNSSGTLFLDSNEERYSFKFSDEELFTTTTTTVKKDSDNEE